MVANVLDRYYLAITLLVTIGWQLLGFAIAWTLQFDKITDFTGGSNFFLLALLTLLMGGTYGARNIVASVLVMIWAARLAGFLLFRVLKTGSDTRFDDIRQHFLKFAGFWTGQIVWVWTVSLPVVILNSPAVSAPPMNGGSQPAFGTGRDIAGIIIFALGLFYEAVGDIQKVSRKRETFFDCCLEADGCLTPPLFACSALPFFVLCSLSLTWKLLSLNGCLQRPTRPPAPGSLPALVAAAPAAVAAARSLASVHVQISTSTQRSSMHQRSLEMVSSPAVFRRDPRSLGIVDVVS